MMCCAACGAAEADHIKLKKCNACYLVKYCSVKCQKEHRPKHKRECKKRAAELRDELLFKQPESCHLGDCPICCLPLSVDESNSTMMSCCSKAICDGCDYADQMRETGGKRQSKCPFCRHPTPKSQEEAERIQKKRIEVNDPVAMRLMGFERQEKEDYDGAFAYFTKATALGDVGAHFHLSRMYHEGKGVEMNEKKVWHHLEEAAIKGHPKARHNLGCLEAGNGRADRAVKHWIIAAKLGFDGSLEILKDAFGKGLVSKEDFAAALRAHQAAVDATKSPQREAAELAREELEKIKRHREREVVAGNLSSLS
ncbi:zf-MYND and TPR domain-containing protein [Skeletonema marinoi]|uniref:Zf-MYND and TPR domain-containing protein n=1 Tax=Skeletonema marinoi TaxID=267567 RepID=A0AAD9DIE2_9STRA|nr:zf-MYND and TPR domain-containing protein [Skeletonema marinoi]|eukprot:scaffold43561_cov146-Skeletonema_marinoi.AAC.1